MTQAVAAPVPNTHQFDDVDGSGQGASFIRFLDAQRERMAARGASPVAGLDLRPGDSVLDLGCGPGTWTFDVEAAVGASGRVVGVDRSEAMISEARTRAAARASAAEFHVGDARHLDLACDTFDVTTASLLLIHIDDVAAAVREMVRVTKPGGRVCAAEPDHQMTAFDGTDQELAERVTRDHFIRLRTPRAGRMLHRLFVDAGLVDVHIDVRPIVVTDWSDFVARTVPERLRSMATHATGDEIDATVDDFAELGARGAFFSCMVTMHATGTKPFA
jgi:ubiquinone/menaquinone biosynthesis C-methylase UbiE